MPFKDVEARRAYNKLYGQQNKDKLRVYKREWLKRRKAEDPEFKARTAAREKQWLAENPERRRATQMRNDARHKDRNVRSRRNAKLKGTHGITCSDFDRLLVDQKGGCAICAAPTAGVRNRTHLFVDHDHRTGRVRGLLCNDCNLGLARFKDRPELLRQGASYLETVYEPI